MAIRRHKLDIYGTELYLVTNQRDWSALRRDLDFLDEEAEAAGVAHFGTIKPDGGGITTSHLALWMDMTDLADEMDLIEIAAHEAAHAVAQLCEWIGHEIKGTDEPSAHMVGWLTRWIIEGVRAS